MSGKLVESFKCGTSLAAYRIVGGYTSTANTVGYPETITASIFGVTVDNASSTAMRIPVALNGICKVYFNDTITAGGKVTCDTAGRGVPYTAVTAAGTWFVGVALETVSATGTIAHVLVNPGMDTAN